MENNEITVVSPKKMNDPFDTLLYDWLEARRASLRPIIEKAKKLNPSSVDNLLHSWDLFEDSQQSYLIRSFVDNKLMHGRHAYQSTLMWAHYANSHKGICIKYSFSPAFRFEQSTNGYRIIQDINYCTEDEKLNLLESQEIFGNMAMLKKSYDWKYENEVRLLSYFPGFHDDHKSIPLDHETFIEAIYFGVSCSNDDKCKVMTALKWSPKIIYYQMTKNYTDIYTLAARQLSDKEIEEISISIPDFSTE